VKLVKTAVMPTAEVAPDDDRPAVGSWWWVKSSNKRKDLDRDGEWLGCVVEVGSNYAKLQGVQLHNRIALDDMPKRCTLEPHPDAFINMKLGYHKGQVRELMGKIKSVCALLGVPMNQALAAAETSTALAVAHGVDDVKKYNKALVKAKEKTLPELFKQVEAQHEAMAMWMKADLIPAMAELEAAKGVTEVIEGKIHMVELYAGLQEELVQVRKGDAAPVDTKVHLMQRRAYMDEECLAKYEAGGMDFQDIKAFDKWLARDENFTRLLPHERCIIAFRIRRHDKEYGDGVDTLANHIKFWQYNEANKSTFLYIRNGRQLWRMETSIDFDEELFPHKEDSDLLGVNELWIKESEYHIQSDHSDGVITARQRNAKIESHKQTRSNHACLLWQWKRAGKPKDNWEYIAGEHDDYGRDPGTRHIIGGKPRAWVKSHRGLDEDPVADYVLLTPESIYHDDVMEKINKASMEHNRVAVIVQGLLDRSTCLHPHPPWRIWTPEGFAAGLELVYDIARAITPGEAPDWEGYRAQLNKSIRVGAHTIGQRHAWKEAMEDLHGRSYRSYSSRCGEGPKRIDVVAELHRDGSCDFAFTRERLRPVWVPADRPGYRKQAYPEIPMSWRCPAEHLTCIDAYTPGDFHMFFDDPRTRADYLEWAPILLSAEDWHHRRKNTEPES
jgi:hypothetical protein